MDTLTTWEEEKKREEEKEERYRSFLTLRCARRWLAVPFERARRVARLGNFSPLPAAVPLLPGVTNVQGHIVAILDIAPLLGEAPITPRPGMYLVLVSDGDLEAGLVCPVSPSLHDVPESHLTRKDDAAYIEATYGWPVENPQHIVEVLSVPRILATACHAYE